MGCPRRRTGSPTSQATERTAAQFGGVGPASSAPAVGASSARPDRSDNTPLMRSSVVSRGFNISYRADGQGAPLLLLRGGSMWADSWWDAGDAEELVDRYRMIAIDFLGHGHSDKSYDPADHHGHLVVSDVVAVLDAEHVERALVWGYSMGATHGALLAVRRPDRVAAVVFGGEAPLPAPEGRREWLASRAEVVRTVDGMAAFFREMGTPDDVVATYVAANDPAACSAVMASEANEDRCCRRAGTEPVVPGHRGCPFHPGMPRDRGSVRCRDASDPRRRPRGSVQQGTRGAGVRPPVPRPTPIIRSNQIGLGARLEAAHPNRHGASTAALAYMPCRPTW